MPDLRTRRWWALGGVSLAVLCVGLDGTVLSVALPTLAKALHASESDLQWFSSGYLLVLAAAMLPAGLLGDRYGRKNIMLISLGLFGVGSAACAYSTSVAEFLVARMLAAVTALVPASRASPRPGLDPVGVTASAAGLVAVIYGLIKAGQDGWANPGALVFILSGAALLAGFVRWERWLARRPAGQPLLDPGLFRSSSLTWGVILATVPILAMLGILFTMPQYFQGVLGTNAMGSGLRLLPLIGGVIAGAVPAARVARLAGAKLAVAAGFTLLTAGLLAGATSSVGASGLFVAAWVAVAGTGTGLAMATATSAALGELTEEHSGVGSAVLQAVNKAGGPFGIAILGSVLSAGYLARLHLTGLSAPGAAAVRQSVFGGVAVARQIRSAPLLTSVQTAFVHGMDLALLVSAAISVAGVVLTLIFLPRFSAPPAASQAWADEEPGVVPAR